MDARFAIDWFAHYALSMDLLESELLTSMGGPPRRGRTALPLRNHLLQSPTAIRDISHRLCAGGFATLFAVARPASWAGPADFLIVVQRRSARVLNVHGGLSVIPKGFHQHLVDARSEVSVGSTIYRELDEELFGRGDYDEGAGRPNVRLNPHHVERLTAPMRWLTENDACRAECVGLGLNLMTGNYDFACLMCFPDEEFWARFGGDCLPNWEAADVQTYSTADPDGLRELIADERWTNEGLFALLEGLRRLAELYPERVQLPNLEVVH